MYMYVIILYYICYIIYIILVKYVHRLQVQCGGLQQPHRRLRSRLWLAGGRWGARRNGGRVGSDLNFWCHVVHLGRNTEDRPKKDKNGPKICQFWSILMIPNQRPQDKPTIFPGFSFQFPLFFPPQVLQEMTATNVRPDLITSVSPAGCEGPTDKAAAMSVYRDFIQVKSIMKKVGRSTAVNWADVLQ